MCHVTCEVPCDIAICILSFYFIYIYSRSVPPGGSHGVMVSTLDSESSDPSSNLGGTLVWYSFVIGKRNFLLIFYEIFLY